MNRLLQVVAGWPTAFCLFWLCACSRAEISSGKDPELVATKSVATHLLLNVEVSGSGLRLLALRSVREPLPLSLAAEGGPWRIELRDEGGHLRHSAKLQAVNRLRGEFRGESVGAPIDGVSLVRADAVFSVRLPDLRGKSALSLHAQPWSLPDEDPRKASSRGEEVLLGRVQLSGVPQ